MIKNNITSLMSKEMDRKNFLKYTGGVLLAVVGVTGLINTLLKLGGEPTESSESRKSGYGGNGYGQ
jgi:hypothetical protein